MMTVFFYVFGREILFDQSPSTEMFVSDET